MLDITDISSNFGESMESASMAGPVTSATSTTCSKISVDVSMMYNLVAGKLAVRIVELRNLNAAGRHINCVQLRLLLLPERKQRHKTKIRYVNATDVTVMDTVLFDRLQTGTFSCFHCGLADFFKSCGTPIYSLMNLSTDWNEGDWGKLAIRFRLYSTERLRRERLLGEALVSLASLALDIHREQRLLVILDSKAVINT